MKIPATPPDTPLPTAGVPAGGAGATSVAGGEEPEPFRIASLGRHSVVYGIGVLATRAVGFIMLPIYTRLLTPSDYGILQLVTMVLEVMAIFAGHRIAFGIYHFYHKADSEDGRRRVLSTAFVLLSATYGVVTLLALIFAPALATAVLGEGQDYPAFIRLAAAGMAFESLLLVPFALIQLKDRSNAFVLIGLARLGMQVVLNLVFLIPLGMGVAGVLLSTVIANLVAGAFLASDLVRKVGLRFDGAAARGFFRLGLPLVGTQVATFLYTFGDRWFLNQAGDAAVVGLYGLAYQFGFLVMSLGFMPFQRAWDPQRFAIAKRPDRDAIYARVFILLNVVLVTAALGVALFAGDVLRVIADPAFHSAGVFVPLLAAAYVFHAWGVFVNVGIFLAEKTEYIAYASWAAALVAVIGYVLLIPSWLAWGAAFATLASILVRFVLTYTFSQRLRRFEYSWGPVIRISLLGTAAVVIAAVTPTLPIVASIALHLILLLGHLLGIWFLVLAETDRAMLLSVVRSRRLTALFNP